MIRILLVDDHSLFRESLGRLLQAEPTLTVAGTCSSTAEAMDLLEKVPVDLVLLDYDLGEQQGTIFLDLSRATGFGGKVLLVTAGMSDQEIVRALDNGASGLFLKHSPPGQLIEAIHQVMAGEMWLDSRAMRSFLASPPAHASARLANAPTPAQPQQTLTMREQAVLNGIFEGLTNKEIAAKLQISESSVKAAIQQLFEKTGVRTRSQLVRIALERHLDQ